MPLEIWLLWYGTMVQLLVKTEPIVKEANGESQSPALIADLAVWGVWQHQVEALFDIQVMDSDAQSYCSCSPRDVLVTTEKEKKIDMSKRGLKGEQVSPRYVVWLMMSLAGGLIIF